MVFSKIRTDGGFDTFLHNFGSTGARSEARNLFIIYSCCAHDSAQNAVFGTNGPGSVKEM